MTFGFLNPCFQLQTFSQIISGINLSLKLIKISFSNIKYFFIFRRIVFGIFGLSLTNISLGLVCQSLQINVNPDTSVLRKSRNGTRPGFPPGAGFHKINVFVIPGLNRRYTLCFPVRLPLTAGSRPEPGQFHQGFVGASLKNCF